MLAGQHSRVIFCHWVPDGVCGQQGRNFAFWKREVTEMLRYACASWLGDFRMDGLRFDSANDLPPQTVQALTWAMRERFPGRILTAEAGPRASQPSKLLQ